MAAGAPAAPSMPGAVMVSVGGRSYGVMVSYNLDQSRNIEAIGLKVTRKATSRGRFRRGSTIVRWLAPGGATWCKVMAALDAAPRAH